MGAAALAVIGGLFVWFSTGLNAASDEVFARTRRRPGRAHAADRACRAGAPAASARREPAQPDPLYVFLKPEIDQGLVTVLGSRAVPIVRIRNRGLFASGSATVAPGYVRLLERIGEALRRRRARSRSIGYTDNQPIHTVQFPSNFQLSAARAVAARAIIVRALGDPGAGRRRGSRRCRPDRLERHAGRPRTEPTDRRRAAAAGLSRARGAALPGLPLVPQPGRRRAAWRAGLAVRPVPVLPGRLDSRAAVIAAMVLIWAGLNFWLDRRRRRNESALVEGVTAAQADPTVAASAEEVAAMQRKAQHRPRAAQEGVGLARLPL